jgi:SnoaL-like domain
MRVGGQRDGAGDPSRRSDHYGQLDSEDVVITHAGTDIVGQAAFKEWIKAFTSKIREPRLVSHDMFSSVDGTRVVSRWTLTGFNQGMFGTPADDRPVQFTGIAIWGEVRNGKLPRNWVERSALRSQSLGVSMELLAVSAISVRRCVPGRERQDQARLVGPALHLEGQALWVLPECLPGSSLLR